MLPLLQRLIPLHLDGREMGKYVGATVARDNETIPLARIKPLHSSYWHTDPPSVLLVRDVSAVARLLIYGTRFLVRLASSQMVQTPLDRRGLQT